MGKDGRPKTLLLTHWNFSRFRLVKWQEFYFLAWVASLNDALVLEVGGRQPSVTTRARDIVYESAYERANSMRGCCMMLPNENAMRGR